MGSTRRHIAKAEKYAFNSLNIFPEKISRKKYLLIILSFFCISTFTFSQETSDVNNPGDWTTGATWVDGTAPATTGINVDINIYGKVTYTGTFSTNNGDLHIYDTLIITGDVTLGNNSELNLYDGALFIIYGSLTLNNKANIDAGGYLIVSEDFTVKGSGHSGGGISSPETPAPVYIGGNLDLPKDIDYGDYPVLDCSTEDTTSEYSNSDCNYGDIQDILEDSIIGPIFGEYCTSSPNITNPGNQVACGSYTLPVIAGGNLSGNEAYFTDIRGTGIQYNAGDIISASTTLYIYDMNGICIDQEQFSITINTSPSINIGANQIGCLGIGITLDAGNSYATPITYLWSNGATTQTTNINTLGTTTVNVTVTDGNTCSGTSNTVDITIIEVADNPIHHYDL